MVRKVLGRILRIQVVKQTASTDFISTNQPEFIVRRSCTYSLSPDQVVKSQDPAGEVKFWYPVFGRTFVSADYGYNNGSGIYLEGFRSYIFCLIKCHIGTTQVIEEYDPEDKWKK